VLRLVDLQGFQCHVFPYTPYDHASTDPQASEFTGLPKTKIHGRPPDVAPADCSSMVQAVLIAQNVHDDGDSEPEPLFVEKHVFLTLDLTPGVTLVLMEGAIHIGEAGKPNFTNVDTGEQSC
jgi:hypothetical protein